MTARVYVASSWRNGLYTGVTTIVRAAGLEVLDWRNPRPGEHGFSWNEIDPTWARVSTDPHDTTETQPRSPELYVEMLRHSRAVEAFASDRSFMEQATHCVLLLPCGRSAHLEAGWFIGTGKPCAVYVPEPVEPELMYLLADKVCTTMLEVLEFLGVGD
jgi:hypothetical protein